MQRNSPAVSQLLFQPGESVMQLLAGRREVRRRAANIGFPLT